MRARAAGEGEGMGSREAFGLRSASCHCSCDACASHASQNCCIEGRLRKHVAHNDSDDSNLEPN